MTTSYQGRPESCEWSLPSVTLAADPGVGIAKLRPQRPESTLQLHHPGPGDQEPRQLHASGPEGAVRSADKSSSAGHLTIEEDVPA